MKINNLLLPKKYDYILYANDFKCKNLFDKENANVLNAYFSSGTTSITSNDYNRTIYIKCKPSTTYNVSKLVGARFVIGYTTALPANGVAVSGIITGTTNSYDGSTRVNESITTGNNAQYLVVCVTQTSQDGSANAKTIMNSVQIEIGATATSYVPYKNYDNTEYVLYSGNSNAEITLNDSTANYKYIEIFYGLSDTAGVASCKVYQPNGKGASLVSSSINTSNSTLYLCCSRYAISTNTMTPNNYGRFVWGATNQIDTSSNRIYIYKVVGYK